MQVDVLNQAQIVCNQQKMHSVAYHKTYCLMNLKDLYHTETRRYMMEYSNTWGTFQCFQGTDDKEISPEDKERLFSITRDELSRTF